MIKNEFELNLANSKINEETAAKPRAKQSRYASPFTLQKAEHILKYTEVGFFRSKRGYEVFSLMYPHALHKKQKNEYKKRSNNHNTSCRNSILYLSKF